MREQGAVKSKMDEAIVVYLLRCSIFYFTFFPKECAMKEELLDSCENSVDDVNQSLK